MSMYGDNEKGKEKEELFYIVTEFIDDYGIAELLKVIADAVERKQSE